MIYYQLYGTSYLFVKKTLTGLLGQALLLCATPT